MLEQQLQQLGFGKNEIKIYLALFELGKCKAADMIENTKLHRNIVYQDLDNLVRRGLITKIEAKGVFEYSANNPESLVEEFENKKQLSQKVAEELIKKQVEQPREVTIYEGVEGLKRSRNKILNYKVGDEVFIFGADLNSTMERQMRQLHKKREAKGIGMRILYDRNANPADVSWRNTLERSVAKYLPFSQAFPIWFAGIGEHLEIGIPQQDNPLIFNIRNKEAVEGFKTFFNYFWESNTITLRGEEGTRKFMIDLLNNRDVYWIGGNGGVEKFYPQVWDEYKKKRLEKKIIWHDLIDPGMILSGAKPGTTIYDEPYYEYKFLPASVAGPHVICIYGNKVANIIWQKDSVINIIEDGKVADGYRKYFEYLWGQDSYVLHGPEAVCDIWLESIDHGELRFINAQGFFVEQYPEMFKKVLDKVKQNPKYVAKNIVGPEVKGRAVTKLPWMKIKYSLSGPKNPNVVWLYGDKVAISNWAEGIPVVFISTNKSLVQSYNDYFEELWGKVNDN